MNLHDGRLLITGASGTLGKQLIYECLKRGIKPIAMVRAGSNTEYVDANGIEKRVADIRNRAELDRVVEGTDAVIHCVAWVNFRQDRLTQFTGVNVIGAVDMYRAAAKAGVKRFVQVSSVAAVGGRPRNSEDSGRPVNEDWIFNIDHLKIPYMLTKHAAEVELKREWIQGGPELVIVNPSIMVAPSRTGDDRGKASRTFGRAFMPSLPNLVNIVDIRDVAPAILTALERGRGGERYLLTGENLPVRELTIRVAALLGKKPMFIRLPRWFHMNAARLSVAYHRLAGKEKISFYPDLVRLADYNWTYSNAKARVELDFAPRPLDHTLRDLLTNQFTGTYMLPGA
jgi:dihydroflavonol-4-reductase